MKNRAVNASSVEVVFRYAECGDASAIVSLMAPAVAKGLVLARSEVEVRRDIRFFYVVEHEGEIAGCVALRDFGRGLYEVRSLVVDERFTGSGLGSGLVQWMIDQAREKGGQKLFSLTYRPGLFQRLGFVRVDKSMFPQKVWADCSKCSKRDDCDEIALLYRLQD